MDKLTTLKYFVKRTQMNAYSCKYLSVISLIICVHLRLSAVDIFFTK